MWNPIRQILPNQGIRKHSCEPDCKRIHFYFTQDDGEENHATYVLQFFLNEWFYCTASGNGKWLPLGMTDSKTVGMEMAQRYLGQVMGHLLSRD